MPAKDFKKSTSGQEDADRLGIEVLVRMRRKNVAISTKTSSPIGEQSPPSPSPIVHKPTNSKLNSPPNQSFSPLFYISLYKKNPLDTTIIMQFKLILALAFATIVAATPKAARAPTLAECCCCNGGPSVGCATLPNPQCERVIKTCNRVVCPF